MIEEVVLFQVPIKVLLAFPPQVYPAEQLLPRYYRSALSQLCSSYWDWLQLLRMLSWWHYMPRLPRRQTHGCPHIQLLSTHPTDLALGICRQHPSRYPNSWRPSRSLSICPHCRWVVPYTKSHFSANLLKLEHVLISTNASPTLHA